VTTVGRSGVAGVLDGGRRPPAPATSHPATAAITTGPAASEPDNGTRATTHASATSDVMPAPRAGASAVRRIGSGGRRATDHPKPAPNNTITRTADVHRSVRPPVWAEGTAPPVPSGFGTGPRRTNTPGAATRDGSVVA